MDTGQINKEKTVLCAKISELLNEFQTKTNCDDIQIHIEQNTSILLEGERISDRCFHVDLTVKY